jgi:prepilin-type N-terminal cleavage/methylation domain-containing protein
MKKQRAFTLLELLITVAVLAIILSVAVPSMRSAAEKRRITGAAEEIYSQLQLARSEAIARSEPVFMNIEAGADWAIGISNDAACDPSDNDPACTLSDAANNNAITHRFTFNDHRDVAIATTANQVTFRSQRGTATGATIDIISTGDMGYAMSVVVGPLGQVSMCSSNADVSKYVSGYRPCN